MLVLGKFCIHTELVIPITSISLQVFYKKVVVEKFAKFTEIINVGVSVWLEPAMLFKRRFQDRCFPVISTNFSGEVS